MSLWLAAISFMKSEAGAIAARAFSNNVEHVMIKNNETKNRAFSNNVEHVMIKNNEIKHRVRVTF